MNEDQQNEYIKVIERLNKKNIELRNNSLAVRNSRKNRLKEEITHLQFKKLFSHVLVRVRPKITTEQVENNLPKEMEDHLAKLGDQTLRIAVYTCITGDYDSPESPYLQFANIDYFLISDRVVAEGWTHKKLDESIIEKYGLSMSNRYVKFHPDDFFKDDYDYAIYVDGNITPVSDLSTFAELIDPRIGLAFHKHCSRSKLSEEYIACINQKKGNAKDIKNQLENYRKEGLPDDYGLIEGNVFICDLRNKTGVDLLHQCWDLLYRDKGGRDQIVWPYVLWKNGVKIDEVAKLGFNVWRNVKLATKAHN